MSVHLVAVKKAGAEDVLAAYPLYRRPYERMRAVAELVPGDHQRDLAVTAIARLCMQTPILERLAEQLPRAPQLDAVASIDRPDQRLPLVLASARRSIAHLAHQADARVARDFGCVPSDHDAFLRGASDAQLDELWTAWEDAIFNGLADALRDRGTEVVSRREHLEAARRLIEAPADAVRVIDATTRVNGIPELVLHVRLPQRLLRTHAWDERSTAVLTGEAMPPIVAARAIAHDTGDALKLFHSVVPTPSALADVLAAWADRGPVAVCVGASCFARQGWQEQWLPAMGRLPMLALLDLGVNLVMQLARQKLGAKGVGDVKVDVRLLPQS